MGHDAELRSCMAAACADINCQYPAASDPSASDLGTLLVPRVLRFMPLAWRLLTSPWCLPPLAACPLLRARTESGDVWAFGANDYGQLGCGQLDPNPSAPSSAPAGLFNWLPKLPSMPEPRLVKALSGKGAGVARCQGERGGEIKNE